MRSPRHLWSGAWREESELAQEELARRRENQGGHHPVDEPPTEPAVAATESRGTSPMGLVRWRRWGIMAAGAVLAAVIVLGAYAIGAGTGDDKADKNPSALPAATGKPLKPRSGQTRAGAIYGLASPAVVSIRTDSGSGTGFLVDDRVTVVTNAHVVSTSKKVTIRFGSDGRDLDGRVLGTDPSSDIAVVHIDQGGAPANAKPLRLADSRSVQVGDEVVAIGNPFGLDRTETQGIISGLGRQIQAPNGFEIDGAIQTDAPINPGNSGGPLLDVAGRVIGMNSQIETGGTSQGNLGIGFAVPSNSLRQVVPKLEQGQRIARAWLGVETTTPTNGRGALVSGLPSGGPAQRAGIQMGDVVTEIDGGSVNEFSNIARVVNAKNPGDKVKVVVSRNGKRVEISVTLGTRPSQVP